MKMSTVRWVGVGLFFAFQSPLLSSATEMVLDTGEGPAFIDAGENHALVTLDWEKKALVYPPEVGKADLVLSLDQHLYPAISPIIAQFARSKGLNIVVREGTCGVSAGILTNKSADITGFCCPPAPSDRLPGVVFHTIGVVANVLIVHPENPINTVSMAEARALFSGKKSRWETLSDPAAPSFSQPIHPITRLHCKLRPGHWRSLLDTEDHFSPKSHNVGSISDMFSRVAGDPNAVGWVARWLLADPQNSRRVKIISIDGVSPNDSEALASGRYRFYKLLNMTTWHGAAANPIAAELVGYVLNHLKEIPAALHIVGADRLRAAGWKFQQQEVVGEPSQ